MFDRCSHRRLAQNVVSLLSEGYDQFRMHVVGDGDDNGIRKTLSN